MKWLLGLFQRWRLERWMKQERENAARYLRENFPPGLFDNEEPDPIKRRRGRCGGACGREER